MGSILGSVRVACAEVAQGARFVRITSELDSYAKGLGLVNLPKPYYDLRHHYYSSDPEALAAFVITLNAINFGSGYFSSLILRPGLSGYFTIAMGLKEHFENEGPLSACDLSSLDAGALSKIFRQNLCNPIQSELLALFAQALNNLGSYLNFAHQWQFLKLVEAANHSAENLIKFLIKMPLYRDVFYLRGLEVPFYKRAQITVSDLALAFSGQGAGEFHDLDELTIFADNLVPHVLWVDKVLEYDDDLVSRIVQGRELKSGSTEEIELRAVTLHAVEEMTAVLKKNRICTTARNLDIFLWNRGQAEYYKHVPSHRTRTTFY